MRTTLIAVASALLLAALVTEITSRFWPNDYLALLFITGIALLINGLFNARMRPTPAAAAAPARGQATRKSPHKQSSDRSGQRNEQRNSQNRRGDKRRGDKRRDAEKSEASPAASGREGTERGTVKWFNRSKGYGFIVRDNGDEIFVHQRAIVASNGERGRSLRDGQKVSFDVTQHEKGDQAENVRGLD